MSSCKDCLENCPEIISDQCVLYTGPDIPLLGICQGEQLSKLESQLITALLSALDGTGINPANVTLVNCAWLKDQLGINSPGLNALLQLLIDNECSLHDQVLAIQNQLAAGQDGTVWDLSCLTGLPDNPSSDQILQATVILACTIKTFTDTIPTTYVRNADLVNLVTPIVQSIINASNTNTGVPQQYTKMVPFIAYEYYGPLSNFDASGIGQTSLGFTKVYICNGSNGTPDRRGRVAVGSVRGVPGGSLDPAVDPTNPNNPNWNLLDKAGENMHLLSIPEMPSHTHGVNDPGHKHNGTYVSYIAVHGGGSTNVPAVGPANGQAPIATVGLIQSATTGISIAAAGGSQAHNNIQPSIAANFIMYIP